MGREVRKVPADWQHPINKHGDYQPMYDKSFQAATAEWKDGYAKWEAGERQSDCEYWEWSSPPTDPEYYRPAWPEELRTHFQIYETVSEGTPLSPPCATIEDLAQWYATNGDPVYGRVSYESALAFCRASWAPSFVVIDGSFMSGVDAMAEAQS